MAADYEKPLTGREYNINQGTAFIQKLVGKDGFTDAKKLRANGENFCTSVNWHLIHGHIGSFQVNVACLEIPDFEISFLLALQKEGIDVQESLQEYADQLMQFFKFIQRSNNFNQPAVLKEEVIFNIKSMSSERRQQSMQCILLILLKLRDAHLASVDFERISSFYPQWRNLVGDANKTCVPYRKDMTFEDTLLWYRANDPNTFDKLKKIFPQTLLSCTTNY